VVTKAGLTVCINYMTFI